MGHRLGRLWNGLASLPPALLATSEQWEQLAVSEEALVDAAGHSGGIRHHIPRLRSLVLESEFDSEQALVDTDLDTLAVRALSPVLTFENARSLEHVELEHINSTVLSLPWSQLKSLTMSWVGNTRACLFILRETTCLENLTLRDLGGDELPDEGTHLRLDRLRSLIISEFAGQDMFFRRTTSYTAVLVNRLVVPALVTLSVEIFYANLVDAVRNMLIRSAPRMEGFQLIVPVLSAECRHLHQLLPASPPAWLDKLVLESVAWGALPAALRSLTVGFTHRIRHLCLKMPLKDAPIADLYLLKSTVDTKNPTPREFEWNDETQIIHLELVVSKDHDPEEEDSTVGEKGSDSDSELEEIFALVASPNGPQITIRGLPMESSLRSSPLLYSIGDD
ncbi:hypothetical protein MIND_00415500 [Mycena indigotica]|uniref:F-box domain-containing protein n=1 Tax=Mycena indigotica TaxID=2126181 RepID=A0A8H6WBC7_9AGAR|nr:uncharacterized protein MIND_00415500 [Mycena indigotica]KAF7306249.1 hypothetical protein MIND_00415500 [Mycena indigotica]